MRVLHMIPDIGISNGIMSVILNFAAAMPDDIKFDVVYFHDTEQTKKEEIERLGGRVYKIDKPSPKDIVSKKTDAFFKAHQGEWAALHIHAPHFAVFIAPSAKRAGIKKICCHCHSSVYSLKGNQKRNQMLSYYAKYCLKDRFACSEAAGKLWYGNQPFTVINNAIDCGKYRFDSERREQIRTAFSLSDKFVVCHIGRTDIPQKNHLFLLSVFAEIVKQNKKAVLMLIGAEKTEELGKQCESLGIEKQVMFLGIRKDVADLLQAADVFLFPSTKEGLPVSVIETQAAGLPVLMSDSVTGEAAVTELVRTEALTESPSHWAETCIKIADETRTDTYELMKDAGWDISSVGDMLTKYYTEER